MNNRLKLFITILSSIFFFSCRTSSLLPQAHNVPLFSEEKELQVSTQITVRSAELQLAYSARPHLAFMLNGLVGSLQMAEIGAGYYTHLNEAFLFEIYGGFGEGSVKANHTFFHSSIPVFIIAPPKEKCQVDIVGTKVFIQPDLGFVKNDNFSLALSMKGSYWYFPKYYNVLRKMGG